MPENTPTDLLETLKLMHRSAREEVDTTKLRYVLYARKSTTSDERQERSIQDQIADCIDVAEKNNLTIIKPIIRESESAKEPDIRPHFKKMVEDIKRGKYDGILTWHPDRLARNMKDAGEIIDLLDKRIIKDLRFATYTFENSSMGKMLLGISFVLSKQYSDHLSESVERGIRRRIEEGQYIHQPKHGYYKDPNQYLRPDGENYILIKEAFKMRLQGITQQAIVKYLNSHNYIRAPGLKGTRKKHYKMTVQKVSKMLQDPFYTGVLMHGRSIVDLSTVYDFVPIVTVDEFEKINVSSNIGASFKMAKSMREPRVVQANFLRQMVICGYCSKTMSSTITTKKKAGVVVHRIYYYRCETDGCTFKNKSVRGRVIMGFILDFLKHHLFTTKKNYAFYVEEMRVVERQKINGYTRELNSLKQSLNGHVQTKERVKNIIAENRKGVAKHYDGDLDKIEAEIKSTSERIEETKALLEKTKIATLTYAEFLEQFENLAKTIRKTTDMELRNEFIKNIFLNFTIENKKVANYSLEKPFSDFYNNGEFLRCRGNRT